MRTVGGDDGRLVGIDVDREQYMERTGWLNIGDQVAREVLVVRIRFDNFIAPCRRQDFVSSDVPTGQTHIDMVRPEKPPTQDAPANESEWILRQFATWHHQEELSLFLDLRSSGLTPGFSRGGS